MFVMLLSRKFIKSLALLYCALSVCFGTADIPTPHYFNEKAISKIRHFTKHSYIVAQDFHERERTGDALEAYVHVGGENLFSFRGKTGFEFISHEQAMGAIYRRDNTIYVSYHGSHFLSDWFTDFNAQSVTAMDRHGFHGNLHSGFSNAVFSSYDSMLRQIKAAIGATSVRDLDFIFCGHSLGGALATIAARQFSVLNTEESDRKRIKLVTFSSPPVGDSVFAANYKVDVPLALRFYHGGDIVPNVPEALFQHVGHPIKILFLEPTVNLLSTPQGLGVLRRVFGMNEAADLQNLIIAAYSIQFAAIVTIVPAAIKLMHLVPEEDVILKAFNYEKCRAGDENYRGVSWWDYTRNPVIAYIYSKI